MSVILKGWRGLSERCGGSLVLSSWPVMVHRGLYLTITLKLWIPRVPFLIFPSSSPLHASPTYIPPAPSLASSCDNGVQQQTVFISDWPIISISSMSSSSLPLLQRTSIVVKTFYILSWRIEYAVLMSRRVFFHFLRPNHKRIKKQTGDFNLTGMLVVINKKRLLCVTVTAWASLQQRRANVKIPPSSSSIWSLLPTGTRSALQRTSRDIWKGLSGRREKNKQAWAYQNNQAANIYRGYLPNAARGKNLLSVTRKW